MSSPVGPGRFAVLDFETTNLEAGPEGRVLEVGVISLEAEPVTVEGRTGLRFAVTDEWETLINPGPGVGVGATHIHHIEPHHVANAPAFSDIAGDLLTRLDESVVVAHNAAFDLQFLDYECATAGIDLPPLAAVCTRDLARGVARAAGDDTRSFRLATCCERAGIVFAESDQHRSLGDARVTALLLQHLMDRARDLDLEVRSAVAPVALTVPSASGIVKVRSTFLQEPRPFERPHAQGTDLGIA
jgi:DNA polymerase-3 subunit epsilon